MSATQLRDRASKLASTDWQAALTIARKIDDPWFTCQAVAAVARFAPQGQVVPLADNAIREAERAEDPYRTAGSSAWPLRALLERGEKLRIEWHLPRMLLVVPRVRLGPSRSEALFLILSAVFPGGRALWRPVIREAMKEAPRPWHWRTRRSLAESILMISGDDEDYARECCAQLADLKHRAKVLARLDAGERLAPREFFWG